MCLITSFLTPITTKVSGSPKTKNTEGAGDCYRGGGGYDVLDYLNLVYRTSVVVHSEPYL